MPIVDTTIPITSARCDEAIRALTERYPFLRSEELTTTVFQRPVRTLVAGNGNRKVLYTAAHHANEWITAYVLLRFAEDLAEAVEQNGEIFGLPARELLEAATIYMVPLVNPDGVDLVTGAIAPGSIQYQAAQALASYYPSIPFPDGWKANLQGTDLNLQYPANWEKAKEIKFAQGFTSPAPRDYVGEAPLSAVESANMYHFTISHDFRLILAYHTQGEVIYWKYLDYEPEKSRQIAEYFAKVSGYTIEETPYASGYAGYKDWFIEHYDRPGYTIEAGLGENPLDMSQFAQIYDDNKLILLGGMTQI